MTPCATEAAAPPEVAAEEVAAVEEEAAPEQAPEELPLFDVNRSGRSGRAAPRNAVNEGFPVIEIDEDGHATGAVHLTLLTLT